MAALAAALGLALWAGWPLPPLLLLIAIILVCSVPAALFAAGVVIVDLAYVYPAWARSGGGLPVALLLLQAALLFFALRMADVGIPGSFRNRFFSRYLWRRLPLVWGIASSAVLALGAVGFWTGPVSMTAAALCAMFFWDMHRQSQHAPDRIALWRVAVAAIGITVASLGLVEIGARMALPGQQPTSQYMSHPERGFTYRPNETARAWVSNSPEGAPKFFELAISSQGLRDREYGAKQPGEYRILLLGDSFTAGIGVETENMPSRILERVLAQRYPDRKIIVINGGVLGYGPWQEKLLLMERGFPLEPDLVIHQLYTTNDIHDELQEQDQVLEAYSLEQRYFWLTRRHADYWNVSLEGYLARETRAYSHFVWMTEMKFTVMKALSGFTRFGALPVEDPPPADRNWGLEHSLVRQYPMLKRAFDKVRTSVASTRDECKSRGIDYVAYVQPDRFYVEQISLPEGRHGERYDAERNVTLFERMLREERIPYFFFGETLRNHPEGKAAFLPYDPHLSERGIEIWADFIATWMASQGLPVQQ